MSAHGTHLPWKLYYYMRTLVASFKPMQPEVWGEFVPYQVELRTAELRVQGGPLRDYKKPWSQDLRELNCCGMLLVFGVGPSAKGSTLCLCQGPVDHPDAIRYLNMIISEIDGWYYGYVPAGLYHPQRPLLLDAATRQPLPLERLEE